MGRNMLSSDHLATTLFDTSVKYIYTMIFKTHVWRMNKMEHNTLYSTIKFVTFDAYTS